MRITILIVLGVFGIALVVFVFNSGLLSAVADRESLSNRAICDRVHALAKQLRDYQAVVDAQSAKAADAETIRAQARLYFSNKYRPTALSLRVEMMRRLGTRFPKPPYQDQSVMNGWTAIDQDKLSGAAPMADAANYMDFIAGHLAQ